MNAASKTSIQNGSRQPRFALFAAALIVAAKAQTPIAPRDLEAPKFEISSGSLNFTVEPSVLGRRYQLQRSDTLASGTWQNLGPVWTGDGHNLVISIPYNPSVPQHFYLLALDDSPPAPEGMSLIPEGSFQMGDQSNPPEGDADELPAHSVFVSGFWLGRTEVTKEQWDAVYSWATDNGYGFENPGEAKAGNHPVQTVSWYDVVKWCNAKSQHEGLQPCYLADGATYKTGQRDDVVCSFTKNGYRLPTEAEWEKAFRGGSSTQNFPWGDTVSHSQANYVSTSNLAYDLGPTPGHHPAYFDNVPPYTSPVGSFATTEYGLYDMAGNVWEWCWDFYGSYPTASQSNPVGPASGPNRVVRGGSWGSLASDLRVSSRLPFGPQFPFPHPFAFTHIGFRLARGRL